jgi:hypothetical protein
MQDKQYEWEGYCRLTVGNRQTNACLEIIKSLDDPDQVKQISDWLATFQFRCLNQEKWHEVLQNWDRFLGEKVLLAEGKLPVDGQDAELIYHFQQKNKTSLIDDDRKTVDLYELNKIINVKKGEKLVSKIPATSGEDGIDVFGNVIPAISGHDKSIPTGKNVVLNMEKDALYACLDGQVQLENQKIHVFPIYEVNGDVDAAIGHIDFVGTVVIRGNVLTGFRINASHEIHVNGTVEGATLVAGGSIHIHDGITAGFKGRIETGENLTVAFIQEANVYAKKDITVMNSIIHSDVKAGGNITCSGRGLIVGGEVKAGGSIQLKWAGNEAFTPTSLVVGVDPAIVEELENALNQLKSLENNETQLNQGLQYLDQIIRMKGALPKDKLMLKIKLNDQLLRLKKEKMRLKQQIEILEQHFKEVDKGNIIVTSSIYPGVTIKIGKYAKHVTQNMKGARFQCIQNEIVTLPLY